MQLGVWMMLATLPAAFINETVAAALSLTGYTIHGFKVGRT